MVCHTICEKSRKRIGELRYILFVGDFMCALSNLFVLVQPEADEGIGGDHVNEVIEAGGDDVRVEASARGAAVAETASDDTEAEANVSMEALVTDVAAAPEV
jgi:hypothetical protein